ncbi:MAG: hypothetical protein JWQ51_2050 [Tardiphaga sp.]|nr:hypothetical protein [Tardiphaga sp.]
MHVVILSCESDQRVALLDKFSTDGFRAVAPEARTSG